MMRLDDACCRRKGEQIIDGCGHLKGALIAMPHGAGDPFRVACPAPDDAADFFGQTADNRPFRQAVIIVINRHVMPGQMRHCR